jgi:hypothetical protein
MIIEFVTANDDRMVLRNSSDVYVKKGDRIAVDFARSRMDHFGNGEYVVVSTRLVIKGYAHMTTGSMVREIEVVRV